MHTERRAQSRHRLTKGGAWKRRLSGATLPVAGVATLLASAIAVGVNNDFGSAEEPSTNTAFVVEPTLEPISRGAERPAVEDPAKVAGKRFLTEATNIRTAPSTKAKKIATLEAGDKVVITNQRKGDWVEIRYRFKPAWIIIDNLSKKKPKLTGADAPLGGACTNGTSVAGAQAAVQAVHQAVCAAFPSITTYGGIRGGGGNHATGNAVDIMVSGELGWQVAEFVLAHAAELGVTEIIYSQQIWTSERAGEGWRPMEDRGSATANHYDHVHVSAF